MPLKNFDSTAPVSGGLGAITPSDTVNLSSITRQIYVTGAGNISVLWADGSTTTEAVAATTFYDWSIQRVNSTSTTATGIRGFV